MTRPASKKELGEDYPKNLMEFEERFATEAACQSYLVGIRWPKGFECPGCGGHRGWRTKRGNYFCHGCKRQTSVTAGTFLARTRMPLKIWFRAMWLMIREKNGISALGFQRELGLSRYETAWKMLQNLRQAMVRPGRDRLHGEVEVDETYVGGARSGKRGRGAEGKQLVVIAAEKDGDKIGRIRMQQVPTAEGKVLEGFIRNHIQEASVVETDGWRGYLGLTRLGYRHQRIKGESVGIDELMPRVHLVASLLKRWLLGTHQGRVEMNHLDTYLDEFTFRFNRRTSRSRGKIFRRLLEQAMREVRR